MRDKNRIEPFLDKFGEVWTLFPELNFPQMCLGILLNNEILESFNDTDEDWLKLMQYEIDNHKHIN